MRQTASTLRDAGLAEPKCEAIHAADEALLCRQLDWNAEERHHILRFGDTRYPELLSQIADPPLLLYAHGDPGLLDRPALAIVGSRNPTGGGVRNAFDFAHHLGGAGFAIVSGLAQGIDAAAHRGALEADAATFAILGHGIDRVYPAANHELAHRIAEHGVLISEFPLGSHPHRRHFPERNRLISGLSLGTLVVEAARRSGSLITARLAGDQGREVFALPGSIHNPLARGCHQLIRQGAKLVETAEDIVSELAPLTGHILQNAEESTTSDDQLRPRDHEYHNLLDALGHDPVGAEELAHRSGLTIDRVSSMLLILELEGRIEKLSGGRYALVNQ